MKATYEVNDLVGSIVQLTFTGMRSVIGKLDLDHTLSSRDQINSELRMILDEATDKWGVKVTRVDSTPSNLKAFQETLFGRVERTRIEQGNPRDNFFASTRERESPFSS